MKWKQLKPDARNTWLTSGQQSEFSGLLPLGDKATKGGESTEAVFRLFSLGVASNRDSYVYNSDRAVVRTDMKRCIERYSDTLARYLRIKGKRPKPDGFVDADDPAIKWTRQTKESLGKLEEVSFDESYLREASYRPFHKFTLYFQDFWNEERYQQFLIFPKKKSENLGICVNQNLASLPLYTLATNCIPDLHFTGDTQCFPFYTYDEDGSNRRENITDWALEQYRKHYKSKSITKWDIFHSTYALLHHPEYRTRYAANLKRELPRIPFPPDLCAFADAGKRLMELHVNYEQQPEYPLEEIETPKVPFTLRVEKMSLSKDKADLRYNQALTLRGIPPAAFEYRLGNRSALEWVIDQYRVSTDSRSGITNDPNRPDDERYILRLIGQVITVSLETMKIVNSLPSLNFKDA